MLKKIFQELVLIRKELQAIRSSLEFNLQIDSKEFSQLVRKAIRDNDEGFDK